MFRVPTYFKHLAIALVFFGISLSSLTNSASSSEHTIYWGEMHLPPISYLKGPEKGTGLLNVQLDQILAALPGYQQSRLPLSLRRLIEEMSSGRKMCFQSLTRSKFREEFIDFAAPTLLSFPNGLITTKKLMGQVIPFLNSEGEVDLPALLNRGNLSLIDFEGRSYSEGIETALRPFRKTKNSTLHVKGGVPDWHLTIKQILFNREDMMIGRFAEIYNAAKTIDLHDQLVYLPIAGEEKYTLFYAGCSKGDWNKTYIQDLNKAILQIRNHPDFLKLRLDRIPPSLHTTYHKYHKEAFGDDPATD